MSDYIPQEYPKWREGVLIQNADHEDEHFGNIVILSNMPGSAPVGENAPQEYPKWVGDVLVNSEDEELTALENIAALDVQVEKKRRKYTRSVGAVAVNPDDEELEASNESPAEPK